MDLPTASPAAPAPAPANEAPARSRPSRRSLVAVAAIVLWLAVSLGVTFRSFTDEVRGSAAPASVADRYEYRCGPPFGAASVVLRNTPPASIGPPSRAACVGARHQRRVLAGVDVLTGVAALGAVAAVVRAGRRHR